MTIKHAVLGGVLALAAAASVAQGERREVKWNNPDGPAIPGVEHHSFKSPSMGFEIGYNVYLPPSYAEGKSRYPVIYFLHGAGGNENSDAGGFSGLAARMAAQKKIAPAICVFPNGGMSGYQDRPDDKVFGETLIVKELVPLIDRSYRTQAAPSGRVLAGFSMGGGGAVRLALKYPDLFSTAASWAGAIMPRRGDPPPELTADRLKLARKIRLLMIMGDQDLTFQGNEAFHKTLEEAKYAHTYRVLPGVPHNLGLYYEKTGEDLVAFLGEGLTLTTASDPARDQAVLEALMLELLKTPRLVEHYPQTDQNIYLEDNSSEWPPSLEYLTAGESSISEGKVAPDELGRVAEAVQDASRRAREGDAIQAFTPRHKRIVIDNSLRPRRFRSPDFHQAFLASAPGYSGDGTTAVIRLSFKWSFGFHAAEAAFVLTKRAEEWTVAVKRISFYV